MTQKVESRCLALLCALCIAACAVLPARAGESDIEAQLSHAEVVLFGKSSTGLPTEQRLDVLETNALGKKGEGGLKSRLAAVNKALGVKPDQTKNRAPELQKTAATLKANVPLAAPPPQGADVPLVAPKKVSSTKELLELGTKKFNDGDGFGADAIFRQVLVSDPHNVDALYNLGAISEHRGDLVSALGFYQEAVKVKPSDPDLKEALASVQHEFSKHPSSSSPLIGGASFNQSAPNTNNYFKEQSAQLDRWGQPLMGSIYSNNVGNQPSAYPVLSVGVPQQPVLSTAQQQQQQQHNRAVRKASIEVIHAGIVRIPGLGGISCPLCEILEGL